MGHVGRPEKERTVSFRISEKVYKAFQAFCKAKGTNVSVYLRSHIILVVEQNDRLPDGDQKRE